MSTHPRDYPKVDECVSRLHERSYMAVPCYGIHPWFLHEVLSLDDERVGHDNNSNSGDFEGVANKQDAWLMELRYRLLANPLAIVGEIGLDGARWRSVPDDDNVDNKASDKVTNNQASNTVWKYQKRILSCPMNLQRQAFEQQLVLATELHRPVSIHVVQAWGELFDSFANVRELMRQKNKMKDNYVYDDSVGDQETSNRRQKKLEQTIKRQKQLLLPPKIYFHAFSGKAGVISSLLAAIEKGNVSREDVYFGFAPVSDLIIDITVHSVIHN
jgi:Tat protein secretion system quality control protein TatD with DNase activity